MPYEIVEYMDGSFGVQLAAIDYGLFGPKVPAMPMVERFASKEEAQREIDRYTVKKVHKV